MYDWIFHILGKVKLSAFFSQKKKQRKSNFFSHDAQRQYWIFQKSTYNPGHHFLELYIVSTQVRFTIKTKRDI